MEARLIRHAALWAALGLASGLFYREFTKLNGVSGGTQLAVVHTHTLVLGTLMLLVVAILARVFTLETERLSRYFLPVWTAGLALATLGMLVKGILQVLGNEMANSPAIAGVSGLGHMTLTAGFALLFLALMKAVPGTKQPAAVTAETATAR